MLLLNINRKALCGEFIGVITSDLSDLERSMLRPLIILKAHIS